QKLTRLHSVMRDVFAGATGPRQARENIDEILRAPASYRSLPTLICFALTSGVAARFFDGGAAEIGTSLALGLLVGLLVLVSGRSERVRRLATVLGGVVAATGATAVAHVTDLFAPI